MWKPRPKLFKEDSMTSNEKAYQLLMILLKDQDETAVDAAANQAIYHYLHKIKEHLIYDIDIDKVFNAVKDRLRFNL